MSEFRNKVEGERAYLLRYATLQLRDAAAAEDAVQETLLAALAGEAGFAGRSNLRTWLTGILKHKIIDTIRRTEPRDRARGAPAPRRPRRAVRRERPLGRARRRPGRSPTPRSREAVLRRAGGMPRAPAGQDRAAFMMREHLGLETAEICKELAVTATHCWVLLHRARLALRECLESELVRQDDRCLKCRQAAQLVVPEAWTGELALGERVTLRVHLAICDGCTNFSEQVAFLRKAVRQLGPRDA